MSGRARRFVLILLTLLAPAWRAPGMVVAAGRQAPGMVTVAGGQAPLWAFSGKIVRVELSGFEPDFDPIDRVVIAATLHDSRPARQGLPDVMVVLSSYLENFKPDTTPVLPDLLHPDQPASSLGGFMQGKTALVNRGGQIGFRGSLVAEVFLDNSVHLVLDVQPRDALPTAPSLRLKGIFTLHKDLTVSGEIHAERDLAGAEAALLRAPSGRLPSWQTVVGGLSIRLPKMVGTAGTSARAPGRRVSPAHQPHGLPAYAVVALPAAILLALAVTALLWRRYRMTRRRAMAGDTSSRAADTHVDTHASGGLF